MGQKGALLGGGYDGKGNTVAVGRGRALLIVEPGTVPTSSCDLRDQIHLGGCDWFPLITCPLPRPIR